MFFKRLLFEKYLNKGETLFYCIHSHWITVYKQMLKIAIFGYLVPISALVFIVGINNPVAYVFFFWISISFIYTVYAFCDWYLDAWLLTDISIIDANWDGFFKQSSSRIDYESIESVDIAVKGIKQTVFNYGDILLVRSSGLNVPMTFVASPQLASSWISRIRKEVVMNKEKQNSEAIKRVLADVIKGHIQVNS